MYSGNSVQGREIHAVLLVGEFNSLAVHSAADLASAFAETRHKFVFLEAALVVNVQLGGVVNVAALGAYQAKRVGTARIKSLGKLLLKKKKEPNR